MVVYQRLNDFQPGQKANSQQVDDEFNQVIAALNQHNTDIANAQTAAINFVKGFGLGDVAKDITGTNANSLDVTGFYYGTSLTNTPETAGYILNIKGSALNRKQFFYSSSTNKRYERTQNNNTWGTWTVATGDQLWTGGSSMNSDVTLTIPTPLSSCPNGWILRWNTNPSGDILYQYIHKDCSKGSDIVSIHPIGGGATPTLGFKRIKVSDTTITGHDYNIQGNNTSRILVEVRAW